MFNDETKLMGKMGRREALKFSGLGMLGLLLPALQEEEGRAPSFPKGEPGVTIIGIGNNYASQEWSRRPPARVAGSPVPRQEAG